MRKVNALKPDFSPVRGKRILAALSGGADSVALLCLLAEARDNGLISVIAAHMDHGIRPESADDAVYCRNLCKKLNIFFHEVRMDIPGIAESSGEGLETAARRIRYEWLRKIRVETGCDYIALAHHMDDQAETVLMHLLRGTGPEGIGGMREISGDLWRPLLGFRKRELTDYLEGKGISWREDFTNAIADTPRNALRLHAIPELEKSYSQAVRSIANYGSSARIESDFLSRLTDDFLRQNLVSGPFGNLLKLPKDSEPAVLRRVIRRICGSDLSHERLEAVAVLCEKDRGKEDISKNLFAERGRLGIYFLPKRSQTILPVNLSLDGKTCLSGIGAVHAESSPPVPIRNNPMAQVLRRDALEGAEIRTRREGDRIHPLGCGRKLLSDYFTDKKLDRPLRDYVPLVAVGNNVLWVVGMGISEDARIQSESDKAIKLEFEPT